YLSHYPTNETTCAVLMSASLLVTIGVIKQPPPRTPCALPLLGILLGLACLSIFTALLAVPPLIAALAAGPSLDAADRMGRLLGEVALVLSVCVVVCGWWSVRNWSYLGKPVVTNWDVVSRYDWWQDPGFRTRQYFFSFGEALVHPFYRAAFVSFWDCT